MNGMQERPAPHGPGTTGSLLRRAGRSACVLLPLGAAGGPQYACALAGALGIHEETARGYLRLLAELGLACRQPGGWSLTRQGRELLRLAGGGNTETPAREAENAGDNCAARPTQAVGEPPNRAACAAESPEKPGSEPGPQPGNTENAGDNCAGQRAAEGSDPAGGPQCARAGAEKAGSGPGLEPGSAENAGDNPANRGPAAPPEAAQKTLQARENALHSPSKRAGGPPSGPGAGAGNAENPRPRAGKIAQNPDFSPQAAGSDSLSRARDSFSVVVVNDSQPESEDLTTTTNTGSRAREAAAPEDAGGSGSPPRDERAPGRAARGAAAGENSACAPESPSRDQRERAPAKAARREAAPEAAPGVSGSPIRDESDRAPARAARRAAAGENPAGAPGSLSRGERGRGSRGCSGADRAGAARPRGHGKRETEDYTQELHPSGATSAPAQPGPEGPDQERVARNLRAFAEFGLLPNRRTRLLAAREHISPDYVRAHAAGLEQQLRTKGESLAAHAGLLLVVLESGVPAPRLNRQGHLEGCRCEACRRAAYRLWQEL